MFYDIIIFYYFVIVYLYRCLPSFNFLIFFNSTQVDDIMINAHMEHERVSNPLRRFFFFLKILFDSPD